MGRPRKRLPLLDQALANGERRLFVRKPLKEHVILEDELGDPLLQLECTDLSLGGLYLRGEVPMRVGSRAFLAFRIPSVAAPLRLVGEVVRMGPHGLGIRFIEVPHAIRMQLEQWLHEASPTAITGP